MLVERPNFLILDEPTNDLDLQVNAHLKGVNNVWTTCGAKCEQCGQDVGQGVGQ